MDKQKGGIHLHPAARSTDHIFRGGAVWGMLACIVLAGPMAVQAQDGPALVFSQTFRKVSERESRVLYPFYVLPASPDKAAEPVVVDARLTERCWESASVFQLNSDMPKGQVSRSTSVRVCYDSTTLYVSFECREPAIDSYPWTRPLKESWTPEMAAIALQTPSADLPYAIFAVDPNTARYDWNSTKGAGWAPEWEARCMRLPEVWRAEIAIPAKSLGVDAFKEGDLWRINFFRHVAATGERYAWQPTLGNERNPALWGEMFLGLPDSYAERVVTPTVSACPERHVVDSTHKLLRTIVRVQPGTTDLSEAKLRMTLQSGEQLGEAGDAAPDAPATETVTKPETAPKAVDGGDAAGEEPVVAANEEAEPAKPVAPPGPFTPAVMPLRSNLVALALDVGALQPGENVIVAEVLDGAEGGPGEMRLYRGETGGAAHAQGDAPPDRDAASDGGRLRGGPVLATHHRRGPAHGGARFRPERAPAEAGRRRDAASGGRALSLAGRQHSMAVPRFSRGPDRGQGTALYLGVRPRGPPRAGYGVRPEIQVSSV